MKKPKIFIACTGVGHINRGYETFTMECFSWLKNSNKFDLFLLKGAGKNLPYEIRVSCLKRNSKLNIITSKLIKREQYWIEQFSFCLSMIPYIIIHKPKIIYYSDFILGTFLWHLRKYLKFKYKLLFANGAPNGPPFKTEDHVQQLLKHYYQSALDYGTPEKQQSLIPYGFNIEEKLYFLDNTEVQNAKQYLNLPINKKIIISVGAINSRHKRMDYIIKEFSKLNHENYFLILLGQIDEESQSVLELAKIILPKDTYRIMQVDSNYVKKYLSVSDYFILASLNEGFGRVLIEAMVSGLIPIVHDYSVTKEVLTRYGIFGDLTLPNILPDLLKKVDSSPITKFELNNYVYKNYSWQVLKNRYINMLENLLK